ncbi:hypothetical protein AVEN_168870-1 [Araneus ventricosus]|uniref:Uncharacterized protein n=1 Tax=Araneus ventricosus TaxID=182803 RepID=A0A4Y2KZD6_ARAVE|nr:hypothetical protein AVEN_168870-1 [Araneus ventricosus]
MLNPNLYHVNQAKVKTTAFWVEYILTVITHYVQHLLHLNDMGRTVVNILGRYECERIILKSAWPVRGITQRRSASESHPRACIVRIVTQDSWGRNGQLLPGQVGNRFHSGKETVSSSVGGPGKKVLKLENIRIMLMETLLYLLLATC